MRRRRITHSVKLEVLYSADDRALVGRVYEVDPAVTPVATIGRDPSATIVLEGSSISRRHARIEWADGAWTVHDDGSTNGVRLENTSVREARLVSGASLWIGERVGFAKLGELFDIARLNSFGELRLDLWMGVATGPMPPEALLRAAEDDLFARGRG